MVKGASEARRAANGYIALDGDHADGSLASKVFAIKERTLSALDRTFAIEICFMEAMTGETGQNMLLNKVSDCLPSDQNPMSPQGSLTRLSALFASQLYHFPSKQAQQSANLILAAVTQISLKRRPMPLDSKRSAEVRQCYDKMAFFLCHEIFDKDNCTKEVYGKTALDLIHAAMQRRVLAGETYSMADLSFGRDHWLLSQKQADELKAWTKKLMPSWDGVRGDDNGDDHEDTARRAKKQRINEATVEP